MPRLSASRRSQILADLKARESFTMKAIARRYGVSRATLWRLMDELRDSSNVASTMRHFDSDKQDIEG
jgi:predicted DNA-binding transcriptional regulator YafY